MVRINYKKDIYEEKDKEPNSKVLDVIKSKYSVIKNKDFDKILKTIGDNIEEFGEDAKSYIPLLKKSFVENDEYGVKMVSKELSQEIKHKLLLALYDIHNNKLITDLNIKPLDSKILNKIITSENNTSNSKWDAKSKLEHIKKSIDQSLESFFRNDKYNVDNVLVKEEKDTLYVYTKQKDTIIKLDFSILNK